MTPQVLRSAARHFVPGGRGSARLAGARARDDAGRLVATAVFVAAQCWAVVTVVLGLRAGGVTALALALALSGALAAAVFAVRDARRRTPRPDAAAAAGTPRWSPPWSLPWSSPSRPGVSRSRLPRQRTVSDARPAEVDDAVRRRRM